MRRASAIILILAILWPPSGLAQSTAPPAPPTTPSLPAPQPSRLAKHRTRLLWISGVTSVTCGALAYASRRSANRHYDAYERSADPARIAAEYDQTVRLDRRAAALFIAAETAFVATIYLGFFVDADADRVDGAARRPTASPPPRGEGSTRLEWRWTPREVGFCWRW